MDFQRRLGLLLTALSAGLLLLFSWVTLAQPISLSGTALSSPLCACPSSDPLSFQQGMGCSGELVGRKESALLRTVLFTLQRGRRGVWADHSCPSPAPLLLPSALAHHPHLCQTSWDADGRHYPGFFCPRLSDTPEEAYCCHLQAAGGSCCTRAEFEALYQVNLSALPPPPLLR